MRPLWRVLQLWRPEAPALALGAAAAIISVLALAGLALSAGAAPVVAGSVVLALTLRGFGAARVLLRYVERIATHRATFRALAGLRTWMFRGLARRSAGGLGFLRSGDALARLVGDVEALDGLYLRILVPLLASTVLIVILAGLLGAHDLALAAAVCLLFVLSAVVVPWFAARSTLAEGARLAEAAGNLRVAALDSLGGMREVRAFGNEGHMLALVQAREAGVFAAQRVVARRAALAHAAGLVLAQAALLLVVLSALPAPVLLPAVLLTLAVAEAASVMPRAGGLAGHAAAAATRVIEASEGAAPPDPARPALAPSGTSLRFDAVHYAWAGRAPTFEGLTIEIPAGTRVAILGPSGSGKSTLAALALKVVSPRSGRVLLGGVNLGDLRASDVHARIAWLSQATHVFSDTVRANLLLGRPEADDDALWLALAQAGLADVVRGLPSGLDTWIGDGGAGLSGGQQRRVALARTLLSPAPILILDEPATGLDDAAERAFFETLNDVAAGRTVILIVHRLLGIEKLDRIWRLSGGKAVAATG